MGMRATVIQYSINVRTPKKEKGRTKLEQEQIWNGFKMFPSLHPLHPTTYTMASTEAHDRMNSWLDRLTTPLNACSFEKYMPLAARSAEQTKVAEGTSSSDGIS